MRTGLLFTHSPAELQKQALAMAVTLQRNIATLAEELQEILKHPQARFAEVLGWVNRLADAEHKLTRAIEGAARSAGLAGVDSSTVAQIGDDNHC
jgi:hypothetical protein